MSTQATIYPRDGGKTYRVGRMTFHFKARAEDTEGAYSVLEAIVPPESGSGMHRHWSYAESAYVVEGRFACHVEGEEKILGHGECAHWPAGAPHQFRSVGPGDGRILFIVSPGGAFERFVEHMTLSSVETGTAKSGPAVDFRALAARHGIEFLS